MQSKTLPMTLKKDLLKTFGELKQTVIWKFEELLPDLPSNVHIVQWAPQQSILGMYDFKCRIKVFTLFLINS